MERYALGDDRAFQELYTLLAPRLYRVCTYLAGRSDADEVLQEVFLKIHRARTTFVHGGSVIAWSFAIARTTCLDRLRRQKRRPECRLDEEQLEAQASRTRFARSRSHRSHVALALECKLRGLSEVLRSAFVLVKVEGLSCAETAKLLGTSVSAIKQRVHRATEALRIELAEL